MVEIAHPLSVRRVSVVDMGEWDEFLERCPASLPFHDPRTNLLMAEGVRGGHASWLELRDATGKLRGGLPLVHRSRWGLISTSSGALGLYGGPVVERGFEAGASELAVAFAKTGGWRAWRRELVWAGTDAPPGQWPGLQPLPTAILSIDTDADFDSFWRSRLKKSRRAEMRRLDRAGLTVSLEAPEDFLEDFYPIYESRARQWRTPPVPQSVLRGLLGQGPPWHAFVVRGSSGEVRGAHLTIELGHELFAWMGTAERFPGGSLAILLIAAEARWCHQQKLRQLNLGTSAGLSGVADFKTWLSAKDEPRWILRWRRAGGRK